MLKVRELETTTCATCRAKVSLVQLNGKTLAIEPTVGWVGRSTIVLEIHRCEMPPTQALRSGR